MANVQGKFYRGETQRRGVTPVSPPNAENDPQDPLNPPGAGNTTTYKQLGDTIDKSFVGKNGYIPVVTDENALTLQPNIPNTGVAVFGGVVYNSTTTVDIGIVKGYIVDNETDPLVSSVQYIEYAGATGVTVTTVGSGTRTYALLKNDGTIHFQNTYPTSEDRKQMIYLFKVGHPAGVITVVANEPDFVLSPLQQFRDLFQAFNYVNEGVYPYADAADLTFNTSAGLIVGNGINFVPEPANPNILTVASTTPCTFVYRTQTGAGGGATTLIDPNIWDNAGTIDTVGGGSNRSTIQYIHYSPNLGFVIQPGQVIYDNLVDAIAAIGKEEHVVYENLIRDAILIGVLALTRSTTDLTDTNDARFFRADIFGQLVGSAAGTSVTTLQRAYLNSLIPQIDTVLGEVVMKNGGASDTDVVFAIRDLLDVDNIQMYGDGRIRHSDAVNADESATLGQVIDLALGDGLISGGIVQWTGTGYNFDVSTAFARFKGVYTLISLPDTLTLTTPDATNDRIDLFILQILFDVDGIPTGMEADFITGTPAANPVKPQINPETQIELTQVLVDAGSTTPTLTEEVIYDQNTEWTGTSSGTGTAVFNSAVDPYQGSISVETTNIQNGFYIQFNNGAEIDISTYQTIGFHIKLKASLGTNQNLYLTFLDGSLAPVSNFVLVNLDKSLLTYQFVGIALNSVNFTSSDVQYIRVSFVRTSGSTTFSGYFFDVFKLEGGIAPPVTNSEHNQLLGLQGGSATERYHLTEVEHQRVQDFSPYDLDQEGALDGDVLTWVAANSRYEPVAGGGGGISGSGTTNEIAYFTGATAIASLSTATYPSLTELSYVKGVTSSIQTQLSTLGSKWTLSGSDIYRNSQVTIGQTTIIAADLGVKQVNTNSAFRIDGLAKTTRRTIQSIYEGSTVRYTIDNYGIPIWRLWSGAAEAGVLSFTTPTDAVGVVVADNDSFTAANRAGIAWYPLKTLSSEIGINIYQRNTTRLAVSGIGAFYFNDGTTFSGSPSYLFRGISGRVAGVQFVDSARSRTNFIALENGDVAGYGRTGWGNLGSIGAAGQSHWIRGVGGDAIILNVVNTAATEGFLAVYESGYVYAKNIQTTNFTGTTARQWKLGERKAATVAFDTTQYITVEVNGVTYNLALAV